MTGPEHYHFAEQLAQEAYNRLGHDDQQGAIAWSAVARVHAALAIAAATALHGVTDHQHWFEAACAGHAHS